MKFAAQWTGEILTISRCVALTFRFDAADTHRVLAEVSSGMWHRVVRLVATFRRNLASFVFTLKMEAVGFFEMLVPVYQTTG
jgi:hypothetical protein